ncbi:hypothetical protein HUT19_35325 [Streptomyces sp. NA02950]|uniref:allene oxide cyclase barrel-like domain-containing protein n=1 Tax=Streptomyces sp. NA02950 TaxID=2742137 RepID=UPI0015917D08|nr:hypothetical protein [Streptomyces sp. NA02950]QKV96329.1 hypothetical protein HUT19_35325 [Streptomyces sp. NA02950]
MPILRSRHCLAAGTLLLAAAMSAPAMATEPRGSDKQTIRLSLENTSRFGNFGNQVPGAEFGSTSNAFREPEHRAFGTFGIQCTVLRATRTEATTQCVGTFDTPHGQITTQGIKTRPAGAPPGDFDQAITGGTGRYRRAAGFVTISASAPGGDDTAVLHIVKLR